MAEASFSITTYPGTSVYFSADPIFSLWLRLAYFIGKKSLRLSARYGVQTDQNRPKNLVRLSTKPTKDNQTAFPLAKLNGKEAPTEVMLTTTLYEHWLCRQHFMASTFLDSQRNRKTIEALAALIDSCNKIRETGPKFPLQRLN